MLKKIIILLVLILCSYTTLAIDINLEKTTYSQYDTFQGTITIPKGTYLTSQKITLSTDDYDKQLELQNLINCNLLDCSSIIGRYTSPGTTSSEVFGPLTGFKVKKNSAIEDAYFDISNEDTNYPDTPMIDIGVDNSPEWIYSGTATNSFDPIILPLESPEFEETIITEKCQNCQKFTLPKSKKYNTKSLIKNLPNIGTLDIYIPFISSEQRGICTQPSTGNWEEVECNIVLNDPLEEGDYYFCLTSANSAHSIATNTTTTEPEGYVRCSSGFNAVNKDYIMDFSAAEYITTLDHTENFNISNTKKDDYNIPLSLTDILNNYLQTCPLTDDYCIIPVNISSKNNGPIKINNINYKEITDVGEVLPKKELLSPVIQEGSSPQIVLNSDIEIDLDKFNFKTPGNIRHYNLAVSFLGDETSKEYNVVQGPTATINASKTSADVSESILFDASESHSSNGSLSYFWKFDDGTNSTQKTTSHSYSRAGTYVVSLKVKDSLDISSTILKAVYIGGVKTTETSTSDALNLLDQAENYYNAATPELQSIYKSLKVDTKIREAKISLPTASQIEVDNILGTIPKKITVVDSYKITPFLSVNDINTLLPLQEQSFKETAQNVNERITQEIKAYQLSIDYLSNRKENLILVTKKISVPTTIPNAIVIDLLPLTLLPYSTGIKFITPSTGDLTKYESSQSIKFTIPSLEQSRTNEVSYTLSSSNLNQISKIKTLILPENLNVALVPLNCGDGICNPAEDIILCPEDCHCGNNKCELDETENTCPEDCSKTPIILYISILVVSIIIGIGIFLVYKNPKLRDQFEDLFSFLNSKKNLFSSDQELEALVSYINAAKDEEHTNTQIKISLLKKGWTKKQVKQAFKKINKK